MLVVYLFYYLCGYLVTVSLDIGINGTQFVRKFRPYCCVFEGRA